MTHTIHNLTQGTDLWHAHRRAHFNASEAAAMLGISPYQTRSALIKEKATGVADGIGPHRQALFDAGHKFEALARPWAEGIIGEDLFPIVASVTVDGLPLSASYDGATLTEEVIMEHKSLNQELAAALERGDIPDYHRAQMEQQLLVIGAKRCLFMASNGDQASMRHAWYESDPTLRAKIVAGWKQLAVDVQNYTHVEEPVKAVAEPVMALPAVSIQINGSISLISNLDIFGHKLKSFIEGIDKTPSDDQSFANAEAAVKTLQTAQDALDAAENAALAQTASMDEMRRTVSMYRDLARDTRLMLEKLVRSRKDAIRAEIAAGATRSFNDHIVALNMRIGKPYMQHVPVDFAGVMRGKKTIASLRDAVNTELARAKIAANEIADRIDINVKKLQQEATAGPGFMYLFPDVAQVVAKEPDDFNRLVASRIAEHKAREEAKAQQNVAPQVAVPARAEAAEVARTPASAAPTYQEGYDAIQAWVSRFGRIKEFARVVGAVEILKAPKQRRAA